LFFALRLFAASHSQITTRLSGDVTKRRFEMTSPIFKAGPARRIAALCLFAFSVLLLVSSSRPWATAQAVWRVEIKEGETASSSLSINNHCAAPHNFRVTNKFKSLRFDQPTDSVLIEASGSKRIAATFDARGLKSKVYGGKVDIECLDCKKEQGCTQDHDELAIQMNVSKSAIAALNSNAKLATTSSSSGNPLLTVNKHHEPNQSAGSWQIGVPITYVITIGNSGAANSHISVADALPTGFVFVSAIYSTASGAAGPSGSTGSLGSSPFGPFSIPQGAQVEIRVTGYFTTSGSKDNTATASATDDNGNPLPVSSSTTNPTNVGTDSVFVPPSATLPNIAVTKTVTPTSSSLPGTLHYTITVANTTATDVYLGGIARLRDNLSANSVPLNWTVTTPTCTATGTAVCPDMPASVANTSSQILFPYDATGGSPANDAGFLPGNQSYKIQFDVTVSRTVTCGSATAQFFNTATLDFFNGWTDSTATDNSSQVVTSINTGLTAACGGSVGPTLSKTQRDIGSGAQISSAIWNSPVKYRIEITNPTSASLAIPLTDSLIKAAGTPTFTATVTTAPTCTGCTLLSTPVLSTPTVNADNTFFTLWTATATVPSMTGTQKAVIEYIVVYKPVCESDSRPDLIVNRIDGASTASQVNTSMNEENKCLLKVQKTDVTGGPIVFGQPHSYEVVYQNLSASQMDIFVRDVLSIKSNRYGTFLVSSASSCTATAGAVTVPAGHPANVSGAAAVYQAAGWRGVRLINEHLTFGPLSTLKCQVTVTAQQPADNNPHCQGADNPVLVNSAYMDPNDFNEGSGTAPQFFSSVETPLPLCRNLIVTKTANANSFGPGQPVDYTITVENIGDDPVSSFQLLDLIQPPLTLVSGIGNQVSQCTPPGDCTSQPSVSGGNQVNVGYGPLQPNHHPVSFVVHAVAPQAGGSYPNVAVGSFLAGGNFYFQGDASHFLQSEENIQVLTPVLSKSFDPAQIAPNGTSTLTFNVTNTNSDPKQTGINFSDNLPPGLQIVSVISNGCSGNVTTSNNGHTVTLTGGQLVGSNADGSGKHTCQISVQVKASGECGINENNKTNFSDVKNLDVSNINEHLDVVGCPPGKPPTLTKLYEPAKIPLNGTTNLAFTITNSSGDPKQTGIAFSDTLPPGLQIVGVVSSGCGGTVAISADHQTVTLSGGQLVGSNADGSGQHSCQIIIKVRASDKCGTYPNTEKNFSDVKNLDISGVNAQLTVGDCPTGGLVIQKDVKGAPRGFTGQFNFLVQCSTPNGFYQQAVTVNWPTPGSTTLPNVPAGSKCTVTEGPEPSSLPAHYNWSGLPVYSANGGLVSIGPLGGHLTVTDTMSPCNDTGQVTITKIVEGLPKDYIGVFQGTLSCWVSNNLVTYPVTLTSPNGLTATVGNIPLGSVCTFQETGQPPLTGDLVWNQPIYSPEFGAVTLSGECCQQITVTNEARHCCTQTGSSGSGTSQTESDYGPKTPALTRPTPRVGKNIRKPSP
jgi:uncharacterized repeat protein (TIGR01451 family)/fimbrial isopeptide formation D2 family protein